MRPTAAFQLSALAAGLVIVFVGFTFENWIIAIILGIVVGVVAFKLIVKVEDTVAKGVNTVIHTPVRKAVKEMFASSVAFETTTAREQIMESLFDKFPFEVPASSWNPVWLANRVQENEEDYVIFLIGTHSFAEARNATKPITTAKLSFEGGDGATKATFAFSGRIDYNDGTVPFSKDMKELVGIVKDTFRSFDSNCKITER